MKNKQFSAQIISSAISTILLVVLCILLAGAGINRPSETIEFPLTAPSKERPPTELIAPPLDNRQGPTDPQELEAFVDGFFNQVMAPKNIPGAAIAMVKSDRILLSKGYGYANLEQKIPVNADRTLFRVASLSKLFTDTAVMQLHERGLLELDVDVNQYLTSFKIDNGYPNPVTAAHLLTQTEGTSQRLVGIAARTPDKMLPLEEFIPQYMPAFVWPPGKLYTYSNMGVTLAGYLVQEISGVPFTQYMDENLLQPLSMERSSFEQPLPPALASELAIGYNYQSGQFKSVPFLYLNIAPAASLSATATDMAHFMIAHLQNGRYQDSRILEPDTVQLMHEQHFTHHPRLPGIAYGFHERNENNLRVIGHSGSMRGYSSLLVLMPEEELGIFVVTNSYDDLHEQFMNQFFDHYYPVQELSSAAEAPADFQLKRFTGTYRDIEYPRDTLVKLSAPFGHLNVKLGDNRSLTVHLPNLFFPGRVTENQLAPVPNQPRLFYRIGDNTYTAFGEDSEGNMAYIFNPLGPTIGAFKKIPWYEKIWFQLGLAGTCTLVFLASAIIWIGGFFKHRSYKHPQRKMARIASLLAGLVSLLYAIFIIGLPLSLWLIGVWKLVYGIPVVAQVFFYIPPVAVALTLPLLVFAVLAWQNKYWSVKARGFYSVITLAALAFIPFLAYWNLLVAYFP